MSKAKGQRFRARREMLAALFTSAAGRPRSFLDSVRSGLMLVILIAITPLATSSMVQGVLQLRRATEEVQHKLLQGAIVAATSQESIFTSSDNVLQALKNVPQVIAAGPDCQAMLYGATLSLPFASNIAVVDRDGMVRCSALPTPSPDVSRRTWWRETLMQKRFHLSSRMVSPVTRGDIIAAVLPLFSEGEAFQGALVLAVDGVWLDDLLMQDAPSALGVAAVFDREGRELVSNASARSARLFAGKILGADLDELGDAVDETGRHWSYAVAPIEPYGLLVAYARPTGELFRWTTFHVVVNFILPVFMVVFTIIAMWLATDRMVLRWLLYLRRVTAVYAQGHYGFRSSRMVQAPSEFRVLGGAIEDMALAVRERDARLCEGLAEKTALVREIHHRIKNSLQIVVSLISLYGSSVGGEKDRRRFDQLRTRVNTLAVVHRVLYEAHEGSQVHVGELLRELGALLEVALDRRVLIQVEAEEIPLSTDLAVPLALLLTELVMTVAARDGPGPERLLLSCVREGESVALGLDVPGPLGDLLNEARAPLAHGFARQLGGTLTTRTEQGHGIVELKFAMR